MSAGGVAPGVRKVRVSAHSAEEPGRGKRNVRVFNSFRLFSRHTMDVQHHSSECPRGKRGESFPFGDLVRPVECYTSLYSGGSRQMIWESDNSTRTKNPLFTRSHSLNQTGLSQLTDRPTDEHHPRALHIQQHG
ncbi:hypothetical protein F2P81_001559 [Scophthalmus maximus]|uniref:Uncharacterized protein n=1 Tax=Scophthalmus maximus TaxID=52904 RepID=A0A6A4TN58_SCOMX|nr:hypothetical protein F2P81_001559 [Scophthalmus maximus]